MSTTACWATNKLDPCVWFNAGYGSYYDMIGQQYKNGYWLSLEGLKILLRYDFIFKPQNYGKYNEITTIEEWLQLPFKKKLEYSAYHISGQPDDILEHFLNEMVKEAGSFYKENPNFFYPIYNYSQYEYYELEHVPINLLHNINQEHHNIIQRVFTISDIAKSTEKFVENPWKKYTVPIEELISWCHELEEERLNRSQEGINIIRNYGINYNNIK